MYRGWLCLMCYNSTKNMMYYNLDAICAVSFQLVNTVGGVSLKASDDVLIITMKIRYSITLKEHKTFGGL